MARVLVFLSITFLGGRDVRFVYGYEKWAFMAVNVLDILT